MELKQKLTRANTLMRWSSNCTNMELKHGDLGIDEYIWQTSNCTNMELKPLFHTYGSPL